MSFWIIVAGLTLLALLFLVVPLIRQPKDSEATDRELQNILIAREKKAQLESQLAQGDIDQKEFDAALQELQTSLALDLEREENITQRQPGKWAVWLVVVAIPALSVGLYLKLGEYRVIDNPALAEAKPAAQQNPQNMSIEAMLERVKQRLRDNPEDAEGWFILGRTLLSMQMINEAVTAFQRTYDLVGDQPGVMFTLADALALQNEGSMTGEPEALVARGLEIAPNDPTGLWLSGLAAEQRKDYKTAHARWASMLPLIADDVESSAEVNRLLAILEKRDPSIEPVSPSAQPAISASITVSIDLDADLRNRVSASDAVFVYAKAMQGPPMPLAVKKLTVGDLPVSVSLSDSDAMMPNMKLSAFEQVIVGARVSKSGNPVAQVGDFFVEQESINSSNPPSAINLLINQIK